MSFNSKQWLRQRSNIQLLQMCQRCIKEEFSKKIALTQPDLLEEIFYYAENTEDGNFLTAIEQLRLSLTDAGYFQTKTSLHNHPLEAQRTAQGIYRGQPIDTRSSTPAGKHPNADNKPATVNRYRVYRGQKVDV